MKSDCRICCGFLPKSAAVALGRWALGIMFLFFGLGKLQSVSGFVNGFLLPTFEKTWLPHWLLVPFGYCLPFLETGFGALLLLGLARNATLLATGLLLIVLTFGQVVLKQAPVVFTNMAYVFFTASLLFLAEHDTWVVPCCRQKDKLRESQTPDSQPSTIK